MENIWKQKFTIKDFNDFSKNSIVGYLGIVFTEKGNDFLKGTMPVDKKTIQPHGILHGGASVVLAETLGSAASSMAVDNQHYTVGMEVNANHIKSVSSGIVIGTAKLNVAGDDVTLPAVDVKMTSELSKLPVLSDSSITN